MGQNIALVLSGGAARGLAHIGVIKEIISQGYTITSIVGTSMGALIGAVFALGKLDEYETWLLSLDKKKLFGLLDFTLSRGGFVKGNKMLQKVEELCGGTHIDDFPISFAAIAADLITKKEVVFTSGCVCSAIRASISLPTILTPVKNEDSLLVDGGVVNNLPLSHAIRHSNDLLVAVNVNADVDIEPTFSAYHSTKVPSKRYSKRLGYFGVINRTISVMVNQMTQLQLATYKPDILIEVPRDLCGNYNFNEAKSLIQYGKWATRQSLKQLSKLEEV